MWTTLFDISDRVENWNTEESAEIITPDHTSNINRQNSKNGADVKNMKDMFRKLHDVIRVHCILFFTFFVPSFLDILSYI